MAFCTSNGQTRSHSPGGVLSCREARSPTAFAASGAAKSWEKWDGCGSQFMVFGSFSYFIDLIVSNGASYGFEKAC